MRRIVDDRWPVKYPPYMSPAAKDLIMRLLERKPAKRIGMLQGRAQDIKTHKWFEVSSRLIAQCWRGVPLIRQMASRQQTNSTSRGRVLVKVVLQLLMFLLQGFDWDALATRRMEPPRRPKVSDHQKRKVKYYMPLPWSCIWQKFDC